MKHNRLLLLLLALSLVLAAAPALASNVSLTQSLDLGISGTGLTLVPDNAYASASATAYGEVSSIAFTNNSDFSDVSGTAATVAGIAPMGATTATTTFVGSFGMSLGMSSAAPSPFGSISQSTLNYLYLEFMADAAVLPRLPSLRAQSRVTR